MLNINSSKCLNAAIISLAVIGCSLSSAAAKIDPHLEQEYGNYQKTGGLLISSFKDCSIKYGQFSSANYSCLKSTEMKALTEISSLYQRNKAFYESDPFLSNLYKDSKGTYIKLKESCENTYPSPLRNHFKNQILSCKVQVDLNKYFLFANELF